MDCCASSYKRIPVIDALPTAVKSSDKGRRDRKLFFASTLGFSDSSSSTSKSTLLSQRVLKISSALGRGGNRRAQSFIVAAAAANAADSNPCNFSGVGTPLEPRSSAGTFLSSILQNQRHLFQYAVAEQLDELAADRYGAVARNNQSLGSSESCLHRRIAEMKENECQIAVEDVMYMSIVHKFSEIKVPMVPKLSGCSINGRLEIWPSKDIELESVHNLEVQEMIKEHLSTILSWRVRSTTDNGNTNQIPRLQLGRIYAASIMYGYFLRSACLRHNLESSLSLTHGDFHSLGYGTRNPIADFFPHGSNDNDFVGQSTNTRSTSLCQESRGGKAEKLKNYIMGFDSETLQRCAKLKSKEAVNLIEKHTWALFGDENSGNAELDEVMNLTNSSMKRLVLEATAFGSFLWDVEEYVDSVYRLKEN